MPSDDDPDDLPQAETLTQSYVLRCRVERVSDGPARPHFVLEEVGRERVWRFTDIEPVVSTLRTRIARLLGSASRPSIPET